MARLPHQEFFKQRSASTLAVAAIVIELVASVAADGQKNVRLLFQSQVSGCKRPSLVQAAFAVLEGQNHVRLVPFSRISLSRVSCSHAHDQVHCHFL